MNGQCIGSQLFGFKCSGVVGPCKEESKQVNVSGGNRYQTQYKRTVPNFYIPYKLNSFQFASNKLVHSAAVMSLLQPFLALYFCS
jgi:hypothetical protein